jgi:hypothetical protein
MSDVALSGVLLWHRALLRKVARATTVKAGAAGGGGRRALAAEVGGGPLLLLTLVLLLVRWVGGTVMVHRPVPQGGTTRRSCQMLPLLCLLVGMDHIVRDDNIADKF